MYPFLPINHPTAVRTTQTACRCFCGRADLPLPELDNKDTLNEVHHLLGYQDGELVACARLLPAGVSYPSVSLGRVATKASARGNGLGHQLLQTALEQCQNLWPQQSIEIGAQEHLREFYARYGFVATSETYLEDGIPHIDMKRA